MKYARNASRPRAFGSRAFARWLLVSTFLWLSLGNSGAAPLPENPTNLEELMQAMAGTPGVLADFVETKTLALLDAPLVTKGKLYFIPPNRMARIASEPARSTLIIDGTRLDLDDEAGGNHIDLASNPVARTFVDNFIVLFNGDIEALRSRYEATFQVGEDTWQLHLVPRSRALAKMIASITMRGDVSGMKSMTLRESGGDTTETIFESVDSNHSFTSDEVEQIFRQQEVR